MRQEREQEDFELRDVRRQEIEQEDFKQRNESRDRKQNGEDLKECAGNFIVFAYKSRIFAGRIVQVNKYGSLMKPINIRI
jgi:hypothetical protein